MKRYELTSEEDSRMRRYKTFKAVRDALKKLPQRIWKVKDRADNSIYLIENIKETQNEYNRFSPHPKGYKHRPALR